MNNTKKISITNPTDEVLYQFPVEVILTTQIDWSEIDEQFTSLRFFGPEGNINHWLEFLDYAGEKAVVWINIPELPTTGTTVYMTYSPSVTAQYQPVSYSAKIERPSTGLTLQTYPQDESGNNLQGLHPCIVKAPAGSWISKNATGDSQNVYWVMVNTPYAPIELVDGLSPAWTMNQTEVPGLYVCSNPDPTTDNWSWPVGYEDWPQDDSGTGIDLALNRVNDESGYALHPIGAESNLVFAPPYRSGDPWSDPTLIWLPNLNGGTLRMYIRLNTTSVFPLYYCDITSPTDSAWEDAGGTSHLTFTYGICTIDSQQFDMSKFGGIEYLSPSVFYSEKLGKYVMQTQLYVSGNKDQQMMTLTSDDGLDWTQTHSVQLGQATGLEKQGWHIGSMEANDTWFLYASTGTLNTSNVPNRTNVYCWLSNDNGASWELQLPSVIAQDSDFTSSANGKKTIFQEPYRPWPIWDEGGQGFILCCGFRQNGDGVTTGSKGGIFCAKDEDWNPYYQKQIGQINGVFWMMGVDFKERYLQDVEDNAIEWPVSMYGNQSVTSDFSIENDEALVIANSSDSAHATAFFQGDFSPDVQVRFRFKDSAFADLTGGWQQRSSWNGVGPQTWMLTPNNSSPNLELHMYNGTTNITSDPTELLSTQSMVDYPATVDMKAISSSGTNNSTMQILRHNGYSSQAATYIMPTTGLDNGLWSTGYTGCFSPYYMRGGIDINCYWGFAKPAFANEPQVTISDVSGNGGGFFIQGN